MICLGSVWFGATAQGPVDSLFRASDYDGCLVAANEVINRNPRDAQAHFYKGASLFRLGKFGDASKALGIAKSLSYQPSVSVDIFLARTYAMMRDDASMYHILDSLGDQGFANISVLQGPAFNDYTDSDTFKNILDKVQRNNSPCRYADIYKKLDFWLGEWEVFTNGNKVANSLITKSEDDCILFEDYHTLYGFMGRSMNYFDPSDSLYKQRWIDMRNSHTVFIEEESRDGYLSMVADLPGGARSKMSYTYDEADDSVVQTVETSSDGGSTWTMQFQGQYVRKSNIKDALQEQLDSMSFLFESDRMAEIAGYYTEDGVIYSPGGNIHRGKEAMIEYWANLKGRGISWRLTSDEEIKKGDTAFCIITSKLTYLNDDGKPHTSITRALATWRETPEGWKISKDFYHKAE